MGVAGVGPEITVCLFRLYNHLDEALDEGVRRQGGEQGEQCFSP